MPAPIGFKESANRLKNKKFPIEDSLEEYDGAGTPQKILIDEFEINPTTEFESLGETIANIIKSSHPRFTIGIYGEWGTGKTTLMKATETSLIGNKPPAEQKILTIWFNAWKYEREEHLATIALMKTIAYAMENHPKYDKISRMILRSLSILGRTLKEDYVLETLKNRSNEIEIEERIQFLNSLEKKSVYFDGLNDIKDEMKKIRSMENGEEHRIVVFIDDLDRCSPKKALEVLESIKVFLDIEGFVYLIGLSHKTVTKLITQAYQDTGVRGEDYIKKIIQIPIKIPEWTAEKIINLIDTKIIPQLNYDYSKFLRQNSQIVSKVVSSNPRQLKRFINNVIIAFETFSSQKKADMWIVDEIFLVQILKTEWNDFYVEFSQNKSFREFVRLILVARNGELAKFFRYLEEEFVDNPLVQKNERLKYLTKFMERTNSPVSKTQFDVLAEFDINIWDFFTEFQDILFNIERWKEIDQITEIVEEIPFEIDLNRQ